MIWTFNFLATSGTRENWKGCDYYFGRLLQVEAALRYEVFEFMDRRFFALQAFACEKVETLKRRKEKDYLEKY